MLYASARPSAAMTRAAFVDRVTPITRPPVQRVQARANAAMVWVLPAPAGATSTDTAVRAASRPAATSAWAASSPAAATAACAWAGVTSCGTSRRASATRYSSRSSHAGVVYRSAPGWGEDRPAVRLARTPREDTSTTSGAGPEGQDLPGGQRLVRQLLEPAPPGPRPGAMAGMARCSSHSSDARVQAAAHFCAPATATRMMRARELASSSAGAVQALRPSKRRPLLRAPADRASTSRSVVRASQPSSSSPADRGPPCSALRSVRLLLGLAGGQRHLLSHRPQRPLGRLPAVPLARYSSAIRATSGVICARRELNASITSWSTPPISNPFPSARGTST